jgi:hypothetical protein
LSFDDESSLVSTLRALPKWLMIVRPSPTQSRVVVVFYNICYSFGSSFFLPSFTALENICGIWTGILEEDNGVAIVVVL